MAKPKRRGRGEGSIRYREDRGYWEGTVSLGAKLDGSRHRKKVTGKTKAEVIERMARARQQGQADSRGLTVGNLLSLWLDALAPSWAPGTEHVRRCCVNKHLLPAVGDFPLAKFDARRVVEAYKGFSKAASAAMARVAADDLYSALAYGVQAGLLAANPAEGVAKPRKPSREMTCLDAAQSEQLIEASAKYRAGPLIALALATGCRAGELLALRWGDIDLGAKKVHVRRSVYYVNNVGFVTKEPKTRQSLRAVAVSDAAAQRLHALKGEREKTGQLGEPVFCSRRGGYRPFSTCNDALDVVLEKTGLPHVRFHDLRHTHASLLLSAGASVVAVSRRLGHASPTVTLRVYAHLMPGDDERLVSLLPF